MILSLWTVPIVLKGLGENGYGLFSLVASTIAMLAFLNAAMTVSTQRFLSVTIGENNNFKLLEIYNLSIILHLILGILIIVFIECALPMLFKYVLNIPPNSVATARLLFHYLSVSVLFSILAVPFDAILNAKENMLAFSVIGIIEAILKLIIALAISYVSIDRLNFYGYMTMLVAILIFFIKFVYTHRKYKDLHFSGKYCKNIHLFKELCSFAGWNTLASVAIIGRNQGIALVLNHFFGTLINAAYGIGNQINGVLGYFSQTIQKSVNPQLMESHGENDIKKMERMAIGLTKFSTLSVGIVALPLLIELPYVLKLWLGNVPEHTIPFAKLIIAVSIIFQLSTGLMSVIQSTGKIKWYTINVCLLMLSVLPISYAVLRNGCEAETALVVVCIIELFAFFLRLFFAHKLSNLDICLYLSKAIIPVVFTFSITIILLYWLSLLMEESTVRLIVMCLIGVLFFCLTTYVIALTKYERQMLNIIIKKIKERK